MALRQPRSQSARLTGRSRQRRRHSISLFATAIIIVVLFAVALVTSFVDKKSITRWRARSIKKQSSLPPAQRLRGDLMPVTYDVALSFVRNEGGELVPDEAQDRQSASSAELLARKLALTSAGAVAFSRHGEPATGEFQDAVVLRTFGKVPSMEDLLSGG